MSVSREYLSRLGAAECLETSAKSLASSGRYTVRSYKFGCLVKYRRDELLT